MMISQVSTRPWASDIYQPSTDTLTGPSQTVDYVVIPYGQLVINYQNRPWFSLVQAEAMLFDQQVWYGLQLATAPLIHAKVEVVSESPEVQEFVQRHWDRFWFRWGSKIAQTKFFGYGGFEINWRVNSCYELEVARVRHFHPRDIGPLVQRGRSKQRGEIAGIGVRGQRYSPGVGGQEVNAVGTVPLMPTRLFGMNALWTHYDARYGSNFGRAITEKAYPAWWDKAMPGGAYDLRRLRGVKDAWIGDVVKYPLGKKIQLPDGTSLSGKDMMREIMENRASGGGIYIPSDIDPVTQQPLFDYTPPTAVPPSDIISRWIEELDFDIFDGLLIPREVVEAASSGSGFSGRSVPLVMFFSLRDMEFLEYVNAYYKQIAIPHVARCLGPQASVEFEMKPIPILDTWTEKISGMQVGGQVGGTTGGHFDNALDNGQQGGGMQPDVSVGEQPTSSQFSADDPGPKNHWSQATIKLDRLLKKKRASL